MNRELVWYHKMENTTSERLLYCSYGSPMHMPAKDRHDLHFTGVNAFDQIAHSWA